MERFAEFICEAGFIGERCHDEPPAGEVSWDADTPWDNNVLWS